MDKKIQIDNRGFSLIELLVCLAISAFVIVSALSLVMVGTKNYDRANKATSVQQEMAFITNLVGQSIREGNTEDFTITRYDGTVTGGSEDYEIHTGKKVIYYDASETSLYVYPDGAPVGDSSYQANTPGNLVSDCVTSFSSNFEAADSSTLSTMTTFPYTYNWTVGGESSLIKINVSVKVKNKTDSTEVIYQIRN